MKNTKLCMNCRAHLALFSPGLLTSTSSCSHKDKKQNDAFMLTDAKTKKLQKEMAKAMKGR